jgi:hypothetical protein
VGPLAFQTSLNPRCELIQRSGLNCSRLDFHLQSEILHVAQLYFTEALSNLVVKIDPEFTVSTVSTISTLRNVTVSTVNSSIVSILSVIRTIAHVQDELVKGGCLLTFDQSSCVRGGAIPLLGSLLKIVTYSQQMRGLRRKTCLCAECSSTS